MEQITQSLTAYQTPLTDACCALTEPIENVCFFDIETTGLSPEISSLYLIGVIFFEKNQWYLTQWFADDYISEADLLTSFASYTEHFSTYVNYNGNRFDIPYLEKKYRAHHLPSPFVGKKTLDVYRQIRAKKDAFPVPNLKLSTIERLLGFRRKDNYSGKDTILLYTDYMQRKYAREHDAMVELKEKLLLHNKDDLIGTVCCTQLLTYENYRPQNPSWEINEDTLILTDTLPFSVPFATQFKKDIFSISYNKSTLIVRVPLFRGMLYHYFSDYKNYYYLPEEDMAIHKSVGIYVDAAYRKKATASNCYTKKEGVFLPLPAKYTVDSIPLFQKSKREKCFYILCDDASFAPLCAEYLSHIIHTA